MPTTLTEVDDAEPGPSSASEETSVEADTAVELPCQAEIEVTYFDSKSPQDN